jgi:hypothetical protein
MAEFMPRWLRLRTALVSPSGHVVYKGQPYPSENSQFPAFDSTLLESVREENVSFAKVVPIQVPPGMHAVDGLLYVMPLLFSEELGDEVLVVPRRFIDPGRLFADRMDWRVLHGNWGIGEEVRLPEIPPFEAVSPSLVLKMKERLLPLYLEKNMSEKECLLVSNNDRALRVAETVGRLRAGRAAVIEQEMFSDPLVVLEGMTEFGCVLGFQNKMLGLAAFMKKGSLVIEIQKPDFFSRSAILAAAVGMEVHVFIEKDGQIDMPELVKLLGKRNQ